VAGSWIVKTEPTSYAWGDLAREGRSVWDGVRNAQALIHLRAMREGDRVLVYHSGDQKALVGLAHVARGPYADPAAGDPKLVVVDLVPDRPLPKPVSLATIKADGRFGDLALVRQGRLSVMPVTATQWKALLKLAGAS
jgi:predicted RNA-binding protein with PUA-like domain